MIGLLFLPAALGLFRQVMRGLGWSQGASLDWPLGILALGTLLICLEQAHMAIADLQQIEATQQQVQDRRLNRFHWVTLSTIAIELAGFYAASIWIGWGALIVLLSQVWFNLLARIQLQPGTTKPVRSCGVAQRLPVLLADGVSLLLIGLWIAQVAPIWNAVLLLAIVLLYGWVKYIQPAK
ncbi:hypothetical protein H6G13_22400 [Pseudanabaena sp. FACHB-2040]|nr:hypothetical protein [Pseudanabaena sp. FACHB-2040]